MSFNNYFNFNRFSNLLKQDLLINKTKYLLTVLGLGLVTYLLSYWFLSGNKATLAAYPEQINYIYLTCFTFYMMAVGIFVGTAFPDLTDKIKTGNYLLSPGSIFEKFLVQFLLRMWFFIPIALGLFWIVIRLAKASLIPDSEVLYGDQSQSFDPLLIPYFEFRLMVTTGGINKLWGTSEILILIFGFFSYGAYLFAGSTYFKRFALIKTVVVSGILLVVSTSFSVMLSHIFYPMQTHGYAIQLKDFAVTEYINSTEFFILSLSLLSWIFFLGIAYFKLKEREA